MRRMKLIIGNWKMHADRSSVAERLQALRLMDDALNGSTPYAEAAVLAPFPYLQLCQMLLEGSPIAYGGQNLCAEDPSCGAYTGEVSAAMLQDFSCRYVTVGHSERRQYYAEDDATVAKKFQQAQQSSGLRPILCIGETLDQRQAGETESILKKQLAAVLSLNHNQQAWDNAVVAYEPVWAIGTGISATAEQAQQAHAFVRAEIARFSPEVAESIQILYGGSVKPSNASQLLAAKDIDGALVGGASLDPHDFMEIIKACKH
jgi:triosephosphate isomerase (TIM)